MTLRSVLFLILIFLATSVSYAQVWTEDFQGEAAGDLTGTGNPTGTWTTTCVGCFTPASGNTTAVFEVGELGGARYFSAGRIQLIGGGTQGMEAEGVWTSPSISISGNTDVSIYIETSTSFTEAGDYLDVYYQLDAGSGFGSEILFHSQATNTGVITTSYGVSAALNGVNVRIIVRAFTDSKNDIFTFDNIAVTNTLFSAVGTGNWSTAGSWSSLGVDQAICGTCAPNNFTNVVIGGGDVISITGAAAAASVTVNGTADALGAGTLDYSGNFALDIDQGGTVTVNNGGQINGNGNASAAITFLDNVSHSIVNNGTISIGDITVTNSSLVSPTTITLSGTGTFTVTDAVTITESSIQTAIFTNNAAVTMSSTGAGALSGDGQWTQGINSTLNYAGSTLTITTLNASNTGNTVDYNNAGIQTIATPSAYHHLKLSGSGTKSSSGNLDINGDLTISGTTTALDVNAGNDNVTIAGNWTVSSAAADPFIEGTETVTFDGTANQTITTAVAGGETFYNLIVNKASGGLLLATSPSTDLSIANAGTMTFTSGVLTTTSAEILTFNSTSLVAGGTSTSYVDGPVRKFGTAAFTFPTGSGAFWARIGTLANSGNATTLFTAQYFASANSDLSVNATLLRVSTVEYWTLSRAGTAAAARVMLFWQNGTRSGITSNAAANLRVARYNGADWIDEGNFARTGSAASGTMTGNSITTGNFTSFTFGSNVALPTNPLPIELLDFSATLKSDQVEIKWSTASELNNDYFTIEKATDLEQFEEIETVPGKGTTKEENHYKTTDSNPAYGRSYYRLKQTDFDGKFSYSDLVVVDYEGSRFSTLKVYPNPSNGHNLTIAVNGLKDQATVPVQIYNIQGQKVFDRVLDVNTPGTLKYDLEFGSPLKQGLYIIKAGQTLQLTQKIIID